MPITSTSEFAGFMQMYADSFDLLAPLDQIPFLSALLQFQSYFATYYNSRSASRTYQINQREIVFSSCPSSSILIRFQTSFGFAFNRFQEMKRIVFITKNELIFNLTDHPPRAPITINLNAPTISTFTPQAPTGTSSIVNCSFITLSNKTTSKQLSEPVDATDDY